MRKLTGFALAVLALSATCALAQGNATSGILYASDFNAWTLPQANTPTAGMIQWPSAAICHISSNGYSFVAVKVGRPLTIVDVDPTLTETVTPVAVTTSGGSCTVTAIMAHTHLSYSVRSGTGGLQEAIDYSIPLQGGAVVVLTPAWTAGGGQSGMITAATGQTSTSVLDQRVSSMCSYTWNGSAYALGGCASSIVGVAAGNGLTSSGTTSITLAVDATKVPFLGTTNTFTQQNTFSAGIVGNVTGHSSLDLPLTGGTLTGNLKLPSILQGGPTIDIRYNGAACDWNGTSGTDDTAAVQTTANTANALYVATGQKVGVRIPGACEVAGIVTSGSGVTFVGPGTVVVPDQTHIGVTVTNHPTFLFNNADSVGVEGLTINVITSCTGNNATCSAIQWLPTGADAIAHKHVYVRNNTIINANWGVLIGYFGTGSGSLADVDISGNDIESPAGSYSNADGIHVAGSVSSVTIANNRIRYRNDAGIGLTSEAGGYVISDVAVTGNELKEDRVGIDCSGCTNTVITGNNVKATIASPGNSNPAFREIYFNGYPSNVQVSANYFENPGSVDGNVAKIDPVLAAQVSWPNINTTFKNNTIGGVNGIFYARGNGISIGNNTFLISGGGIILDYDGADNVATANVTIGTNQFQSAGVVTFGGGCALYNGVNFFPQQALGTLTVSNVGCVGAQTVNFPGTISLGTNSLSASANNYLTFASGSGAPAFGANFQDATGHNLLTINNDGSGINVPDGPINTGFYYKMGGGSNGGLRNSAGTTVVPGSATDFQGTSATIVGMCEAKTMTTGNLLKVGASGGCADSGVAASGLAGGVVNTINGTSGAFTFNGTGVSCTTTTCTFSGGGVSSIDAQTGAFTFAGAGVSHVGNAYTFSGTGSGVSSVGLTTPSWLTVSGSPVTTSGTLAVTATGAQTANQFLATPNGSTGAVGLRAIAAADLPATIGPATTYLTNVEFSNGTCTTAKTIDPANGNRQKVTLTNANTCALTFTQPASGTATVQLKVIQSAVSTFNGGISGCKWPGGAVPTITQTTGAVDMVAIYLDGTNAYCQIAQAFQ